MGFLCLAKFATCLVRLFTLNNIYLLFALRGLWLAKFTCLARLVSSKLYHKNKAQSLEFYHIDKFVILSAAKYP